MRQTLSIALDLMFGHKGGYSNRATDSGGPTKYGITHRTLAAHRGVRAVSAEAVKAMTRVEAEKIYARSYWIQSGGDLLPVGLDYAAFDFGVNSGPATAVKTLQRLLAVTPDGIVGEQTARAARSYAGGVEKLIRDYVDARMAFLRSLTNRKTGFPVNGRGWTIRVTGKDPHRQWKSQPGVVGYALDLARGDAVNDVPMPPPARPHLEADGSAKARAADKGIGETLKKPEAWGPLAGLLSAVGALASGSGPLQWALAALIVAGAGYGFYRLVLRDRAEA